MLLFESIVSLFIASALISISAHALTSMCVCVIVLLVLEDALHQCLIVYPVFEFFT